jgi:hypothetical protein
MRLRGRQTANTQTILKLDQLLCYSPTKKKNLTKFKEHASPQNGPTLSHNMASSKSRKSRPAHSYLETTTARSDSVVSYVPPSLPSEFALILLATSIFAISLFVPFLRSRAYLVPIIPTTYLNNVFSTISILGKITLALHVAGAIVIDQKMKDRRVERGSVVWWSWVISCFFEGSGGYNRFDRVFNGSKQK